MRYITLILAALAFAPLTASAQTKTVSGPAVTGTMVIDFKTRQRQFRDSQGLPTRGAKDIYAIDLKVGAVTIKGKIDRTPRLGGLFNREAQKGQIFYALSLGVGGTYLGDWLGTVVTDDAGQYLWNGAGDPNSKPRIQIQSVGNQAAFTDYFAGIMLGKGSQPGGAMKFYRKLTNGKTAVYTALNTDPMDFQNLALAKGPLGSHGRVIANGKLIYDRESGSWITENLKFTTDGKKDIDEITGSIRWIEDPNRASTGKGEYAFNLRWNEGRQAPTEDNFSTNEVDEDSFFAVDASKPGITGTVVYQDKFEGETVVGSTVTFNLTANAMERNQILAFVKLWLVGVGPLNDE